VRSVSGAFYRYVKGKPPAKTEDLSVFLDNELLAIQNAINDLAEGYLEFITVAPARPREGMLRNANAGVLGASKGTYCYHDSAWSFLG
jgi:hypothetical protein